MNFIKSVVIKLYFKFTTKTFFKRYYKAKEISHITVVLIGILIRADISSMQG